MPHQPATAEWQWLLYPAESTTAPMAELTEIAGRSLVWRVDGTAEASFTLDGRHELAAIAQELVVDLRVFRDNEPVFHGRLGSSTDEITADEHKATFTANDYSALFMRQEVRAPALVYSGVAQGSIVRQLIAYAQARTGGNFGVAATSTTVPDTATVRTITFEPGKWVAEAIGDLAALENGFDWWIDTSLVAQLVTPGRGVGKDLVCELGSTVSRVARTFDPSTYANALMVTGGDGTTAVTADAADLATRVEGRFGAVESFPDITSSTVLQARANQARTERSTLNPAYACTMIPGRWSPRELWVGDTTYLVVRSGRLNIASQERVVQIDVGIDEENVETVALTLGAPLKKLTTHLLAHARRLERLERLGAV